MKSLLAAKSLATLLLASSGFAASFPFEIDVANREQVRSFFNGVYAASLGQELAWTGSIANCDAGIISAEATERIRLRINYFRAMAGVSSAIELDPLLNAQCQQAALMFARNGGLSHSPPPTWECFTAGGAAAAASSDIAYGAFGPDGVDGFMFDPGAENAAVGHRRWLLLPQSKTMGAGTIPENGFFRSSCAIWVVDENSHGPRPPVRDNFVSWPPPGFTPHKVMPVRWSLSFPLADFNSATVTVSTNGVNVPLVAESVANGSGENTLVWRFSSFGVNLKTEWPKPPADTTYHVHIENVGGVGVPSTFDYDVTVFNPETPGPDTIIPVISGPDVIPAQVGAQLSFPPNPLATGYDLRITQLQSITEVEGAENYLVNFTTNTTKLYPAVVSPGNTGERGFRLCHAGNANQSITYGDAFVPGPGAEIRFASRLSRAQSTEFAKVQVSTNDGAAWTDLFSQPGIGFVAAENSFVQRTISLGGYVSQEVRLRFAFTSAGATFDVTVDNVGWYFDDITFINCSRLLRPIFSVLSADSTFEFTPSAARNYMLEARPKVWGDYALDYGPPKFITATEAPGNNLAIIPVFARSAENIQFNFQANSLGLPVLFIYKANSLAGPWTPDLSATIDVVTLGTLYRATIPAQSAPATFYRPGLLL